MDNKSRNMVSNLVNKSHRRIMEAQNEFMEHYTSACAMLGHAVDPTLAPEKQKTVRESALVMTELCLHDIQTFSEVLISITSEMSGLISFAEMGVELDIPPVDEEEGMEQ